jgi:hypothetical protein
VVLETYGHRSAPRIWTGRGNAVYRGLIGASLNVDARFFALRGSQAFRLRSAEPVVSTSFHEGIERLKVAIRLGVLGKCHDDA